MNRIKVVTIGYGAQEGHFICAPDDDYPIGSFVPEGQYVAEDQDWQQVVRVRGHADIGTVTCAMHNGDLHDVSVNWEGDCWLLVDEDGSPVRADLES